MDQPTVDRYKWKQKYAVILSMVGIGICAALGIVIFSKIILDQPLKTGVNKFVQAGLITVLITLVLVVFVVN